MFFYTCVLKLQSIRFKGHLCNALNFCVFSFKVENPEATNKVIDPDLKDLFEDLLHRTTYTYKITRALKIDRGTVC